MAERPKAAVLKTATCLRNRLLSKDLRRKPPTLTVEQTVMKSATTRLLPR